jgi:hypothetical protein
VNTLTSFVYGSEKLKTAIFSDGSPSTTNVKPSEPLAFPTVCAGAGLVVDAAVAPADAATPFTAVVSAALRCETGPGATGQVPRNLL